MMNHTNFIAPVSPGRQREVWYWYLFSLLLLSGLIITIITLSIVRLRAAAHLKKEYAAQKDDQEILDKTLCTHRSCAQEHAQIADRMISINRWQSDKEFPATTITELEKLLNPEITLEQLTISARDIEFTLAGSSSHMLTQWAQKAAGSSWGKEIRLVSLQKKEGKTIALFKKISLKTQPAVS